MQLCSEATNPEISEANDQIEQALSSVWYPSSFAAASSVVCRNQLVKHGEVVPGVRRL